MSPGSRPATPAPCTRKRNNTHGSRRRRRRVEASDSCCGGVQSQRWGCFPPWRRTAHTLQVCRSDARIPSPACCFSLTSTPSKPTPPAPATPFIDPAPSPPSGTRQPRRSAHLHKPNFCFVLIDSIVERADRNMCQVSPELKNTNSNFWDFFRK